MQIPPLPFFSCLGISLHSFTKKTFPDLLGELSFDSGSPLHIATVNPEFLVLTQKDPSFKKLLQNTDLRTIDGFGITWLSQWLYKQKTERITGVDTAEILCEWAEKNKLSVFFLGGFGVAKKAAAIKKKQYSNLLVAGAIDGNPHELSPEIVKAQPDIIFVAFGCPKQEQWIAQYKDQIPNLKIAIGIGGTFDFWTEKMKRAPKWMQKIGIEWLYRLIQEPKRIKRIWNAVVVFSFFCIQEKYLSLKKKQQGGANIEK